MNPICKVDLKRPECQRWMNEVYARCWDLFRTNPPIEYPTWWLFETPPVYKDVDQMTAQDCHKLKRQLDREVEADTEDLSSPLALIIAVGVALAIAATILLLLTIWGLIRWRRTRKPDDVEDNRLQFEQQKAPPREPEAQKKKKKLNYKKWIRGRCRPCLLHSEKQIREFELKTERQIATHNERMKLKIALWTKAQEDAEMKQKQQGPKQEKKKDRRQQKSIPKNYDSLLTTPF